MACFLVTSDDEYQAFFNADMICMFRVKKAADGSVPSDDTAEVEVEYVGGSKTRLVGATAKHFLTAMDKHLGGRLVG